jgi:hypothetical protein
MIEPVVWTRQVVEDRPVVLDRLTACDPFDQSAILLSIGA